MRKYITMFCASLVLATAAAPAFADCNDVAKKAAAEQNGKLEKVTPAKGGNGQNICVIVITVPGGQGEKPRRVELALPMK